MSDLKPCPFCGKEAIVVPDEKRRGVVRVGCWNVCAINPVSIVRGVDYADATPEAIERWNRRGE